MTATDVSIRDEGTIVLFEPRTDAAKDWMDEHLDPDALCWGRATAVGHHDAADIIRGMIDAGLTVRSEVIYA